MHATKGAWVGQTFALAKCNDSGVKKSRIRRSKEERKEMVESFIKRYQTSNNGSFPSLNLTHKEVGGSFYTVREIVRDIIQENRVLGPPKLPPGEQNMNSFLEQYPLGSISVDPQIHMVSSNETQILLNDHQDTIEEQVLDSRQIPEPNHGRLLDTEQIVNGSTHAAVRTEEFEDPIYTEFLVERHVEGERDEEEEPEAYQAKISHITEDVVIETFPLRPVSNTVYDLDEKFRESTVLVEALDEKSCDHMEFETGNNHSSLPDRMQILETSSEMVNMKEAVELTGPLPEINCNVVNVKSEPTLKSQNSSTTKESISFDVDDRDLGLKDTLLVGDNLADTPGGIHAENLNSNSGSSLHQPTFKEATADKNQSDIHTSQKKGNDPLLNRINLESWEATSKKSAGPETNPLVAFVRAFIAAFVKFWSE